MDDVCLGHSFLHIANTSYEEELEGVTKRNLENWMTANPMYLLLQFLPVVYARQEDAILISALADTTYAERMRSLGLTIPKLMTFREKPSGWDHIEPWGHSQTIEKWAREHKIPYKMPKWELLKQINSKEFSFNQGIALPHAQLLKSEADFDRWVASFDGPKVLKTCFGVSGRGHHFISDKNSAMPFLKKQWDLTLPVIGEPWVERILDFSTQWEIDAHRNITYVGSTVCLNDPRGSFHGNIVGVEKDIFGDALNSLKFHCEHVQHTLHVLATMGYFGNVGFDAMLYRWKEKMLLQPIVEINARKTMGWVALQAQKKMCPHKKGRLELLQGPHPQSLLPNVLSIENKKIPSKRSLVFYF